MDSKRNVGVEIRFLYNAIRQLRIKHLSGLSPDNTMTFMQTRTIDFVYENSDTAVFQRDIEQEYGIRRPTATKILQSMEKEGLITRHGVDYDARLKQIVLTEKAIKLHDDLADITNEFEEGLTRNITNEEIEVFFSVIDKVKDNLDAM